MRWLLAILLATAAFARPAGVSMLDDFISRLGSSPLDGRVYRLDLDVTGDGASEIFLGVAGGHALHWVVYSPDGLGQYRELVVRVRPDAPPDYDLTQVIFDYDDFYYSPETGRFSAFLRAGPGVGGWIRYRVITAGFTTLSEPSPPPKDQALTAAWQASGRPPMYWAALRDLQSSPKP